MTLAWRIKGETMTIQQALDRCLDDIQTGRASAEECLRRYPEFADELRPMLRLAARLESANEVRPSRAYKSHLRKQLMGEEKPTRRPTLSWRLVLLWILLSAILIGALVWLGITFQAAGGSLPPMTLIIPYSIPCSEALPGVTQLSSRVLHPLF